MARSEALRQADRQYYSENKDVITQRVKDATRHLRMEVLLAYGAQCKCCGESRYEFLAFDHVNDDGNEHRKVVSAHNLPRWLKRNNYPSGFQVLCHNCNGAKGAYGACPHVMELA